MRIPSLIQIESSTACDGRCVFCPHSTMQRQRGQMSDKLFEKIVWTAAGLGVPKILLFLNGEPFVFPKLFDWLDLLREAAFTTNIFTNGAQLTKEKAEKLVTYGDVVESVVFSLAGVDAQTHKDIMGLDHNRVKTNIEYFMSINQGRIKAEGHMPLFSKTSDLVEQWKELWGSMLDVVGLTPMFNWGGNVSDPMQAPMTKSPCGRVNHMTVLWDGRVTLCCMDAEGEVILGDLNTQSITEVFNSELAMKYFTLHYEGRRNELPLCSKCNML